MKFYTCVRVALIAFLSASSSLTWSQTAASPQRSPRELLKLGNHLNPAKLSARAALGVRPAAAAKVYKFASADYPGTATSLVFDENLTTVLGDSAFNSAFGFTLNGGNYAAFSVPSSTANETTGINTGGEIVGIFVDFSGITHGFLDNAGTFTTMDFAGGSVEPFDINDSGVIVGAFIDTANVTHGFSSPDGHTFTTFDVPGSTSTIAAGINTAGVITGVWVDSTGNDHGFTYSGGLFTSFDVPASTGTTAIGINDKNEIAGYYEDAASVLHGFVYSKGAFATVDVPGASATQLTRIKNNGKITGVYNDSNNESHGLTGH